MRTSAVRSLVVLLSLGLAGTALGAGQTPPPGQTPGKTPGQTGFKPLAGFTPGQTPGQTPGKGGSGPAPGFRTPVCPAEAHIRLPQRASNFPDPKWTTTVYGNCSDPDGPAQTAALVYTSPGVVPAHVPFFLDEEASKVTHLTFMPEPFFTGPDFMKYYAIDSITHRESNVTDFYIEVVAGLKVASAVWTGSGSPDDITGTEVADTIEGLGGADELDGGKGPDELSGGPGDDVLDGGAGNDIIDDAGGAGSRSVATAAAKKFHNIVNAGAGKDTINVRNRKRDKVNCGKGKDKITADKNDKLTGCEKVTRKK